jgi:hypothetical protein
MTRMSTAVAAALVSVALLGACGGDDDDDAAQDVASLGTEAPAAEQPVGTEATDSSLTPAASTPAVSSTPPQSAPTDPEEAMLGYTECMRDHGIEMEDPRPAGGEGGGGIVAQAPDDDEEFQAAQEECEPLLDAVVSDFEPDPEQEAEIREQLLEYAQCMRGHGIDMPDPTFDEVGGGLVVGPDADIDVDSDEFRAADDECAGGGMGNPVTGTVPEDP